MLKDEQPFGLRKPQNFPCQFDVIFGKWQKKKKLTFDNQRNDDEEQTPCSSDSIYKFIHMTKHHN